MPRKGYTSKLNELRAAVKKGDKEAAKKLLLNNSLVKVSNHKSSSYSLLHWATMNIQDTKLIEILSDQKDGINTMNSHRQSVLDFAVQKNNVKIIQLFLKKGFKIEKNLDTLIHDATKTGNDKIVKLFVDHGVKKNLLTDLKDSLNLAIENGFSKIVQHIILHCKFTRKNKKYIPKNIVSKIGQQYDNCVKILLQHGFKISPGSEKDQSFIYSAVENGHSSIVHELTLLGIDVNMINEKTGLTLLHAACLNKHVKTAELLVKHGADVNSEVLDENLSHNYHWKAFRKTALHISVYNADVKLVKLLLNNGAQIKNDPNFFTAINIAIQKEYKKIIQVFLDYVDVNAIDCKGKTLLHMCTTRVFENPFEPEPRASRFKTSIKHEIAELLLNKGANVDAQSNKGKTPLFSAIKSEYTEMIKLLLKYKADINHTDIHGNTPLHKACDYWLTNDMQLLLNYGARIDMVNEVGQTPFHLACNRLCPEIIQLLINHNANIDAKDNCGMTPLHFAADSMDRKTMSILLKNGAKINVKNNKCQTPLHILCSNISEFTINDKDFLVDEANLLLQYNIDIDATDEDGRTPLFYACIQGSFSLAKLLLDNNADINHADSFGLTPICIAAECPYEEVNIVELFINNKSTNINFITNDGETFLHILAKHNQVEIVEKYFSKMNNIDIDTVSKTGLTALHIAAVRGHPEMIKCLLKHGASVDVSSDKYRTSFFWAYDTIHKLQEECRKKLRSIRRNCDEKMKEYHINESLDYYETKINNVKKCCKILREHIIKLVSAKLKVNCMNYVLAYNIDYFLKYLDEYYDGENNGHHCNHPACHIYKDCETELERLKLEKIKNSKITFHDLLTNDMCYVAKYGKIQNIVQLIDTNVYRNKFPVYLDIIKNRVIEGMKWDNLKKMSQQYFRSQIYRNLPYVCLNEIFNYMNTEELKVFMKAFKPVNAQIKQ